jgi:hypothetical protein
MDASISHLHARRSYPGSLLFVVDMICLNPQHAIETSSSRELKVLNSQLVMTTLTVEVPEYKNET